MQHVLSLSYSIGERYLQENTCFIRKQSLSSKQNRDNMRLALAKQGTSRLLTDFTFSTNLYNVGYLWSVIINQINTFNLSRTCYWNCEPLIHPAYYVNQNLPIIYDNSIHCLYYLKSVRCRWRLVPCYARAGHIFVYTVSDE